MTTVISYADPTDGYISSLNAAWSTAQAGSSLVVTAAGTGLFWGKNNNSGYTDFRSYVSFTYTPSSTEVVTAAYVRTYTVTSLNTAVSRDFEWREYDWGASLDTADWRTPTQMNALSRLAYITNAEDSTSKYTMAGSDTLVARLASAGPLRLVGWVNNTSAPTSDQGSSFGSAEQGGTTYDPALIYTTGAKSRLFGVLGAQVQLSDGTHAYLEMGPDSVLYGDNVGLYHHNGTSASVIGDVSGTPFAGGFARGLDGAQAFALTADSSDNLYVLSTASTTTNSLAVQAFQKGVGYSWTAKTILSAALPSYTDGSINNIAAAWHNVGTNGTIMVVASHTAGRAPNTAGDIVYALLNCQSLLASSGTLLRASGSARGVVVSNATDSSYYTDYANETGSVLDVVAAPSTNDRGYVWSATPAHELSESTTFRCYRYILNSGGTGFSSTVLENVDSVSGAKDGAGKARIIALDSSACVKLATNSSNMKISVVQNIGTASTFAFLGSAVLTTQGITSFPSAATLATSLAWDAIHDPSGNKVWVYYLDTANSNRLMRTSVNMNTYLAAADEVQVSAAIGAVGSTNYAIRVHRGKTNGQKVLVSVANKTSGGTHSTIYIVDTLNLAPNAPTLTTKSNYDATQAATFAWTFSDPNAGDTQSAYQLQIVDVSDGSVDVDTGKVTSGTSSRSVTGGTLVNGKSYQWRVATWDALDAAGPYSTYGTFSTSAGGTVTITNPAADNPVGVNTDDYTIQWSVSGTTQAAYRVVVTRTSTGATLVNTGYVTSTATSYNVAGMLTGVEYTVAVTVRNAALVESGTGTRKITPDYDNVPQPTVSVTPATSGECIAISVTNPAPTGDNPSATSNQILRRRADSTGNYTAIATISPDSSYDDYAVASGVTYEYIARAVA